MEGLVKILVFSGIGLVIGLILVGIRVAVANSKARKLLRRAEDAEKQGNLPGSAAGYKELIFAVAANEKEVPMWLERLQGVYKKMGIEAKTDEVLKIHRTIVEVWKSKVSDSEKRSLHKSAMESLRGRLDALP